MSKYKLTDAIGGIGDDLIVNAKKSRAGIIVWKRIAAAVACLIILAGVIFIGFPGETPADPSPILQNTTTPTTVSSMPPVTPTTIPSIIPTTVPPTISTTTPTTAPPSTTTAKPSTSTQAPTTTVKPTSPTAPLTYPVTPGTSSVPTLSPNSQMIQISHRVEVTNPSQGFVSIGDGGSSSSSGGTQAFPNMTGISVQAKALSILPDVYMRQNTACILIHMKTLKAYNTGDMVDEFYFMLPVEYKTNLMKYDVLVIKDMIQYSYEYHVFYNQAKKCYEVVTLPIFGTWAFTRINSEFWAFSEGTFDVSLWESNAKWADNFKHDLEYYYDVNSPYRMSDSSTIEDLERTKYLRSSDSVKLYSSLESEDALNALHHIAPFNNGIYLTGLHRLNRLAPDVQSEHTRWINGYPTNQYVKFFGDHVTYSQASFNEEDTKHLPDLASGLEAVENAYYAGLITPPHITEWETYNLEKLNIIGSYVKANDQVYGMITVQWQYEYGKYTSNDDLRDEKYFIIQYGSDMVESIDRDALLELVGTDSGVFAGEYDELGRVINRNALLPVC